METCKSCGDIQPGDPLGSSWYLFLFGTSQQKETLEPQHPWPKWPAARICSRLVRVGRALLGGHRY